MTTPSRTDRLVDYLRQDPANASLLSEAVHAALAEVGAERARAVLELAEPVLRQAPTGRFLEASVLLAGQRPREARALLQALRDEGVDAAGVLFNLGLACLRSGDAPAAVEILQALPRRPDAPPAALAWLLRALQHAGRLDDADAVWQATPAALRTPDAAAVASMTCFDLGRLDDARRLSTDALVAGSTALEGRVVRASVAVIDADFAIADEQVALALADAPHEGRVLAAAGMARLARNDLAAAEAALFDAAAAVPDHVASWHLLGWCRLASHDLAGARASFETALALDRNFGETHGALAAVMLLSGDLQGGREALERARGLDPQGLALQYARLLQSGVANDPEAVRRLALRLFDARGLGGLGLVERMRG